MRTLLHIKRDPVLPFEIRLTIVMVILDRNLDLIPMISHSWTVVLLIMILIIVSIACFRHIDNQT